MSDRAITESRPADVPAPPPDDQNEAIIDALKTFQATGLLFVLFVICALFIILRTRMG